jgi:2-polyprenyl-6-methoxyphenol hydroxylase-like FAD-dependent oxidoreductase
MNVIIVGGGIGGLTAARALLDAGCAVTVIERRALESMLGGPGGIFIQKNAMRVFEQLAGGVVAKRLMEEGGPVLDGGFFDVNGKLLYLNSPSFAGETNLGVALRRPELQRVLHESLPEGTVRVNSPLERFEADDTGVTVLLRDGQTLRCDVLIGADGLRSAVRAQLAGIQNPTYSGQTCWRGVITTSSLALDSKYTWQELWGVGSRFGYFLTGRGTACFYAFFNTDSGGKDTTTPKSILHQHFGHYGGPVPHILETLDDAAIYRDDIFDRDPPSNVWGQGRVTLLGDAAHPTQPTLGQGGCMAIEDAFELARALRKTKEDHRSLNDVLRTYEASRTPRVGRVVSNSRQVARLANTSSTAVASFRNLVYRLTPRRLGDLQFRWLFDYRPQW